VKQGLIFDLDGTLVDSLDGLTSSLNRALALSGLPTHPRDAIRGFIGNGARILVQRSVPAGVAETVIGRVEEDFKADYDTAWPAGTKPYDGIVALLETLQARGHPLAVLSNKPHPFTETIIARIFPTVRFSVVLGQRAGIPHKPDPAGALEIAGALDLAPAECTVIGDSTMDIETARNAGMRAIAVTWGFHDRERLTGADVRVDAPGELEIIFR
jgi:phosphoglycolate phosphatase